MRRPYLFLVILLIFIIIISIVVFWSQEFIDINLSKNAFEDIFQPLMFIYLFLLVVCFLMMILRQIKGLQKLFEINPEKIQKLIKLNTESVDLLTKSNEILKDANDKGQVQIKVSKDVVKELTEANNSSAQAVRFSVLALLFSIITPIVGFMDWDYPSTVKILETQFEKLKTNELKINAILNSKKLLPFQVEQHVGPFVTSSYDKLEEGIVLRNQIKKIREVLVDINFIIVIGHHDDRNYYANNKLAQKRADTVARWLSDLDIKNSIPINANLILSSGPTLLQLNRKYINLKDPKDHQKLGRMVEVWGFKSVEKFPP